MSKFIDDEAVQSENDDDDDDLGKKKRRKKKTRILSDDECDVEDQANSEDERFIDDSKQVDNYSDVSEIHSSEEDICSGDEVILREARGSRLSQVQDSEDDFSEHNDTSDEDSLQETPIDNYRKKELQPIVKKTINEYFSIEALSSTNPTPPSVAITENSGNVNKMMAPARVMPCMAFARNKNPKLSKAKMSLGDHRESPLPSVVEDKPEPNWNFLKRASNLQPANGVSVIPGVTRLKDGSLVLITKDGKHIKVTEH